MVTVIVEAVPGLASTGKLLDRFVDVGYSSTCPPLWCVISDDRVSQLTSFMEWAVIVGVVRGAVETCTVAVCFAWTVTWSGAGN